MNWLRLGLVLIVLVGSARLVEAALPQENPPVGEKDKEKHAVDEKHGDQKHADTQDPFKGTLDVAIWTILVFLGLVFILKAYAWGPIQEGLELRERRNLEAAEAGKKAQAEADALRAQFQKDQEAAAQKVRETIDAARRDAQQVVEKMKADAQEEIAAERERLKREVAVARDQALQEIWQKAATLATDVSGRILPRELNESDQRRLVEMALNELQSKTEEIQVLLKSRQL
jgi:F-type H+-transporting ATPase subunit b